ESLARTRYAGRAAAYPVLAMALHKLGQTEAALQELENASRAHNQAVQEVVASRDRLCPLPSWYDWVSFQHFRREAHRLIEQAPPPDDPRLDVLRGRAYAVLGRL